MNIGIIGTGSVGIALAAGLTAAGHDVSQYGLVRPPARAAITLQMKRSPYERRTRHEALRRGSSVPQRNALIEAGIGTRRGSSSAVMFAV